MVVLVGLAMWGAAKVTPSTAVPPAIRAGGAAALVVATSFVLYMNRFQIVPDERALQSKFGADFEAYGARVRRWI